MTTLIWCDGETPIKNLNRICGNYQIIYLNEITESILSEEVILLFLKKIPDDVDETTFNIDFFEWPKSIRHRLMYYEKKYENAQILLEQLFKHLNDNLELSQFGFKESHNDAYEGDLIIKQIVGFSYLITKQFDKAIDIFISLIPQYETKNVAMKDEQLIILYHNLSMIYHYQNDYHSSLKYLLKEKELFKNKKLSDKQILWLFKTLLRELRIYYKLGEQKLLLLTLKEIIDCGNKIKSSEELIDILEPLLDKYHCHSHCSYEDNKYSEALSSALLELEIAKVIPFDEEEKKIRLSHTYMLLATIYLNLGNYEMAINNSEESIFLREQLYKNNNSDYWLILDTSYNFLKGIYEGLDIVSKVQELDDKINTVRGDIDYEQH